MFYCSRNSAKSLETESGLHLETADVLKFKELILQGSWDYAERILDRQLQISLDEINV
jgi:hypothetical protein